MIRVPCATDVELVAGFLQYRRHLGLFAYRREKPVDVYRSEPPCRGKLIIWRQLLVTQKHHAVRRLRLGDGFHLGIGHGIQVDADDLGAAAGVRGDYSHSVPISRMASIQGLRMP